MRHQRVHDEERARSHCRLGDSLRDQLCVADLVLITAAQRQRDEELMAPVGIEVRKALRAGDPGGRAVRQITEKGVDVVVRAGRRILGNLNGVGRTVGDQHAPYFPWGARAAASSSATPNAHLAP